MHSMTTLYLLHTAANRAVLLIFILLMVTGHHYKIFTLNVTLFFGAAAFFLFFFFPLLINKIKNRILPRIILPLGYILFIIGILGFNYLQGQNIWLLLIITGMGLINGLYYSTGNRLLLNKKMDSLQSVSLVEFVTNLTIIMVIFLSAGILFFNMSKIVMPVIVVLLFISFLLYRASIKPVYHKIPASYFSYSGDEKLILLISAFIYALLLQPFFLFLLMMSDSGNSQLTYTLIIAVIPSVIYLLFTPVISGLFNYLRKGKLEPGNSSKLLFGLGLLTITFFIMSITPTTLKTMALVFILLGISHIFTLPILHWRMVSVHQKSPAAYRPLITSLSSLFVILFTAIYSVIPEKLPLFIFGVCMLLLISAQKYTSLFSKGES